MIHLMQYPGILLFSKLYSGCSEYSKLRHSSYLLGVHSFVMERNTLAGPVSGGAQEVFGIGRSDHGSATGL